MPTPASMNEEIPELGVIKPLISLFSSATVEPEQISALRFDKTVFPGDRQSDNHERNPVFFADKPAIHPAMSRLRHVGRFKRGNAERIGCADMHGFECPDEFFSDILDQAR